MKKTNYISQRYSVCAENYWLNANYKIHLKNTESNNLIMRKVKFYQ